MSNRKVTSDVSDANIASAVLASISLNKADRILEAHATAHDKVVVKGSNLIPLRIGDAWFLIDTDTNVSTVTDLDAGAMEAGKDYCVYACDNAGSLVFKISMATTFPAGFNAVNSRKIGGFHTLCVSVGGIAGHSLTGWLAGEILPASVWDLKHRPLSEPAGMVYSEAANIWVDIYLTSGTGASTASVNGGTISDSRNWMDFVDDFGAVRKKMLDDIEFALIAAGSNEQTNIAGSADPVTTGGHIDTAGRRMISNIGCEDCCGVMYQWLRDQSYRLDCDGSSQAAAKTVTTYHAAAPGGSQLYLKFTPYGDPYLCCNFATTTTDKWLAFGSDYKIFVKHDADAATGGLPIYYNQTATDPAKVLVNNTALLKNCCVYSINSSFFLQLTHNAAAASSPALYYDDGADQRLEFISGTSANGTIDLAQAAPAFSYYALPGSKGQFYKQGALGDVRLLAGAVWYIGSTSGSRARYAHNARWNATSSIGGRGRSEPR